MNSGTVSQSQTKPEHIQPADNQGPDSGRLQGVVVTPEITPRPHSPIEPGQVMVPEKPLAQYLITGLEPGERALELSPSPTLWTGMPELPELTWMGGTRVQELFSAKLQELRQCLHNQQYQKGIDACQNLQAYAASQKAAPVSFKMFLDTMLVLLKVNNGDYSIIGKLPAEDRHTFIQWHMDIANQAAHGSAVLQPSRELELYCYRRAADAGSPLAREILIRQLLLNGGPEQPNIYQPSEALRHLKARSANGGALAVLEGSRQDLILQRLITLAANPDDRGRDALAEELMAYGDAKISALVVAFFIDPCFGTPNPKRALETAQIIAPLITNSPAAHYWHAKALLKFGSSQQQKRALDLITKADRRECPATLQLLTEHYLQTNNIHKLEGLLKVTHDTLKPLVRLCPDLANALHIGALFLLDATVPTYVARSTTLSPRAKLQFSRWLEQAALEHGNLETRAVVLSALSIEATTTDNFETIGSASVIQFSQEVKAILAAYRFSQDGETMVFLYLDQTLENSFGDEQLIEQALNIDPVATCCRLIALRLATEHRLLPDLLTLLLAKIDSLDDLPERWLRSANQATLYSQIYYWRSHLKEQEKGFRILSALAVGAGKQEQLDATGICTVLKEDYGQYLQRQGRVAEANETYRQVYQEHQARSRQDRPLDQKTVPAGYWVYRKDLPAYYWQINSQIWNCRTPAETLCMVNRLIDSYEQMANDPNPAVHIEWFDSCCYFFTFSSEHLTVTQIRALLKRLHNTKFTARKLLSQRYDHSWALIKRTAARLQDKSVADALADETLASKIAALADTEPTLLQREYALQMRLPARNQSRSYLREHHLEADMRAATTPGQRLTLLEQAIDIGNYDVSMMLELMFGDGDEQLPQELHPRAAKACTTLMGTLPYEFEHIWTNFTKLVDERFYESLFCIENVKHHPISDQARYIAEQLRDECAQSDDPVRLARITKNSFSKHEYPLYEPLLLLDMPLDTRLNSLYPRLCMANFFQEYGDHLAASALTDQERQPLVKIWQNKRAKEHEKIIRLFAGYVLGKECRQEIINMACDTHLFFQYRINALCIGCELGLFTESEAVRLAKNFAKESIQGGTALAVTATTPKQLQQHFDTLQKAVTAEKLSSRIPSPCPPSFYVAVGHKALGMGEEALAFRCFKEVPEQHGSALLEWKQSLANNTALSPHHLLAAAANGKEQARYRLVDCLLDKLMRKMEEPREDEEFVDPLILSRCHRYLQAPSLIPNPERELYQGIAEFTGLGCQPQADTGMKKICGATTDTPSPLPALRLTQLILRGLLPAQKIPFDPLAIFADKLQHYPHNLPKKLNLSDPDSEWKKLIAALKQRAQTVDDPDNVLMTAAQRLEQAIAPAVVVPEKKTSPSIKRGKKTAKKQAAQQSASAKSETVLAKQKEQERRAQQEEQLITELSQLVLQLNWHDVLDIDQQQVTTRLAELRAIQGQRFPSMPDQELAKLVRLLPFTEEHDPLIVTVFQAIKSTALANELLSSLINSFMVRYEVTTERAVDPVDPATFQQEKQILVQMMPKDMVVTEEDQRAVLVLAHSYAPNLPATLTSILKLANNWPLLQRFLLEQPQLTPTTHQGLYLAYQQAKDGADFRDIPTARELQLKIFDHLAPYTANQVKHFLLCRPELAPQDQKRIITNLGLGKQKQLLDDSRIAKIVCNSIYQEAENPRRKMSPEELQSKAKAMVEAESSYGLVELLNVYAGLAKRGEWQQARTLQDTMRHQAQACLQQPLAQWDGNKKRLYAMAIMDTLG